jgi:hypothetical protein
VTVGGHAAIGHPIPADRLASGLDALREMMPDVDTEMGMMIVGRVAALLERDDPYRAQAAAMVFLDTTGAYRLMAHLLT